MEIGRDHVVLQWFTRTPCPTRVQIRESDLPATAFRGRADKIDVWAQKQTRVVNGPAGTQRTYHVLRIEGLKPGRRYFYRVYDPGAEPSATETAWGAGNGYRREFAVSTQAPAGRKTIIHMPVKVLLLPNVINVASAHDAQTAKRLRRRPRR
jgi:hypothetical protein